MPPNEGITDPLLTSAQAAEMFEVHPDTVRQWAKAGQLDHITLPSGHLRFRKSVIERALEPTTAAAS